jgi:hypothetical protein
MDVFLSVLMWADREQGTGVSVGAKTQACGLWLYARRALGGTPPRARRRRIPVQCARHLQEEEEQHLGEE